MPKLIPLEIAGLTKTFVTPAGPFVAVQDVNACVHDAEFVCMLGHSGCGKSTVLSIIAGLQRATNGRVVIDGAEAHGPGTDRAVVFQAPCLLPWLTVRENVALAVKQASPHFTRAERQAQVDRYLELVGVADAADQLTVSSPLARSSACRWRVPCQSTRGFCSSTNRFPCSTR